MKGNMNRLTLKVSEIKNNPNNPRLIRDDKFKKLGGFERLAEWELV